MTNKEIEFILSLKDQLSAKWNSVATQMGNKAKELAATFQRHWAAISVGAYAAFEGMKKAFELVQDWAAGEAMAAAFRANMQRMGKDAEVEFARIETAAKGLVDEDTLYKIANRFVSMGMPIEELAKLFPLAQAKAREFGMTASAAFEAMAESVGKGAERGLKDLGIVIDRKVAEEAFALTLGKTAKELTDLEKRHALLNAVLRKGTEQTAGLNLEVKTLGEQVQTAAAYLDKAKDWLGEGLARIGAGLLSLLSGIAAAGIHMARVFIYPLARMQEALIAMGLTTSTSLIDAEKRLIEWRGKSMDMMASGFTAAFASSQDLVNAINGGVTPAVVGAGNSIQVSTGSAAAMVDQLSAMKKALEGMVPGTRAYIDQLVRIEVFEEKLNRIKKEAEFLAEIAMGKGRADPKAMSPLTSAWDAAVKGVQTYSHAVKQGMIEGVKAVGASVTEYTVTFGEMFKAVWENMGGLYSAILSGLDAVRAGIVDGVGKAWEDMFGEANSLLEMFIQNFIAQLSSQAVTSAISGLLSLIPGGSFLGSIFGGIFHAGGTVPKAHGGLYVNAPATKEFPIIVRGGETIRTESQEAQLRGALTNRGGTTIVNNFHFSGPIATAQAFKEIVERGMREIGASDVTQYFKNSRSNLVLAT